MPGLTLALALHNHQPVGNFTSVFEEAYRSAYEPMIGALERHSSVRLALHYSGPVLDWVQAAHPDFVPRVRALVARGQVEIMTGGYYEPILPIIPDRDKRGQIRKLTDAVRTLFGYEARGLWLAERVWEPHLPKSLAEAGVRYTIVDDTHFHHVGMRDADLVGHYMTEEDGATVSILPSAKALRYRIPWATVDELLRWLRTQATDGDRLLTMGDDGEKFGLWPGTRVLCWDRGWVDAFFAALESNRDWLVTVPPGEWVASHAPLGRTYLPTASYDEMTEWALPAAGAADLPALKHRLEDEGRTELLPYLKGGFWRYFLVKYPEINTMHKEMLRIGRRVWNMRAGRRRKQALDHLWQAQCNCPYWHGVFGGIYLGHIRAANYGHLIEAERLADAARSPRQWVEAEELDVDADGRPEVVARSDALVLSLDPADGGGVVTWYARHEGINLLNVVTRRPEGYHETLREALSRGEAVLYRPDETESIHTSRVRVKEWGLDQYLTSDWYRRASFLDHIFARGGTLDAFARGELRELGDFVNQPYACLHQHGAVEGTLDVRLSRHGHVWVEGGSKLAIHVEKTLTLRAGSRVLEVGYRVTNDADRTLVANFAIETNWSTTPAATISAGDLARSVRERARIDGHGITLRDPGWKYEVAITPAELDAREAWTVPIEVVSASEAGFERTYQGVSIVLVNALDLPPGASWQRRWTIGVDRLEGS
jgi:alpha-amylase